MAGGVLLAQGLSCIILLVPLLQDLTRAPRWESVAASRTSVAVQSVTGMLWVIVGLVDDRINEAGGDRRRETFGLLVLGFSILILSCVALMLSFWPVQEEEEESTEPQSTTTTNPDMEPLLANGSNNNISPAEDTHQRGDGEQTTYRLLEDGPEPSPSEDNFVDENDDDSSHHSQPTSRIRGTRRLLKLAAPQVMYLYIGCITLLVRLPFSLSIPHFISTTLSALAHGDFDRARREIFWLFLLGTIDACLDFWCIFWFGYANLRIVRGVRIDTFASILRQEVGFFDKHTSGELASRLNSDCGEMAGGK